MAAWFSRATASPRPSITTTTYAGLDVTGKIVLVLRHEPQENDDKSVFEGKTLTRHAQFAKQGRQHAAHAWRVGSDPDHDVAEPSGQRR